MKQQVKGQENLPHISIIVAVFNTNKYLKKCLDSLLEQTISEIEIICVDNGSTDGSLETLESYRTLYHNIVILSCPQGKQGGARNLGIEMARGAFIGFVDSDDYVSSDMFQQLVTKAYERSADIVVCGVNAFVDGQNIFSSLVDLSGAPVKNTFSSQEYPVLFRNTTSWNKIYKKSFLEKFRIRFPQNLVYEDVFFVILALLCADKITCVSSELYYYRKGRPNSTTTDRGRNVFDLCEISELTIVACSKLHGDIPLLVREALACKYLMILRSIFDSPYLHKFYESALPHLDLYGFKKKFTVLNSQEVTELWLLKYLDIKSYKIVNKYTTFLRRVKSYLRRILNKGLNYLRPT